jgi:hypothetical protein
MPVDVATRCQHKACERTSNGRLLGALPEIPNKSGATIKKWPDAGSASPTGIDNGGLGFGKPETTLLGHDIDGNCQPCRASD